MFDIQVLPTEKVQIEKNLTALSSVRPWKRMSKMLVLLHDSPSASVWGKIYQWACEGFVGRLLEKTSKKVEKLLLALAITKIADCNDAKIAAKIPAFQEDSIIYR